MARASHVYRRASALPVRNIRLQGVNHRRQSTRFPPTRSTHSTVLYVRRSCAREPRSVVGGVMRTIIGDEERFVGSSLRGALDPAGRIES